MDLDKQVDERRGRPCKSLEATEQDIRSGHARTMYQRRSQAFIIRLRQNPLRKETLQRRIPTLTRSIPAGFLIAALSSGFQNGTDFVCSCGNARVRNFPSPVPGEIHYPRMPCQFLPAASSTHSVDKGVDKDP